MVDSGKNMTQKLLELMKETGYPLVQHNGQRKFGPPPEWSGSAPPKGCEVFIGKLPREIFEDELVPIFSRIGRIYEMRLMMDFSGSNRGYGFVTYTRREDAYRAVKELNGLEIRPHRHLGVVKSVDNCRLFVGGIPKDKSKKQVFDELSKRVDGIVDVILYKNCYDKNLNRGFAFVEFTSHRAAAMARRSLVPGCVKIWDQDVMVDWAEPEPDIDDEQMEKVKVLYVRNFQIKTTSHTIQAVFESAIQSKVERVKKMHDYAFIHFYRREHAEIAMAKLQSVEIDGSAIEIRWAKPVVRELYKIQKMNRGNAKFNNSFNLNQTLQLYKQQLEKKEYIMSPKDDEGIGSACAGDSNCGSPSDTNGFGYSQAKDTYLLAPAKLDSMCKRYMWSPPIYQYQKCLEQSGSEVWVGRVELPAVGAPLLGAAGRLGPFVTRPCLSVQQAHVEAAETALQTIKLLKADIIQQSMVPSPTYSVSPVPSYVNMPYDYMTPATMYPPPPVMSVLPTVWRSV